MRGTFPVEIRIDCGEWRCREGLNIPEVRSGVEDNPLVPSRADAASLDFADANGTAECSVRHPRELDHWLGVGLGARPAPCERQTHKDNRPPTTRLAAEKHVS